MEDAPQDPARPLRSLEPTLLAAGLIALAVACAYGIGLSAPFLFDDLSAIVENPTIRQFSAVGQVFAPPANSTTVGGRPLLNLSFALNYLCGGLDVRGYRAVNLAIHLAAALVLLGIVRRTLLSSGLRERFAAGATWLAAAIALLWALHPLQTGAVTFVAQRAESLAGLCYLLTIYLTLRGAETGRWGWYAAAVLACGLGAGVKEYLATAPLVVLLFDRAFWAGSWRQALRQRWGLYLGLAATWLLLAGLMWANGDRGGTVGGAVGISRWDYAMTQCRAIVQYLRLAFWPVGLCFDYGDTVVHNPRDVAGQILAIAILGLATLGALWRWRRVGFLGAFFFLVLAPTSSFVPLATQTTAEHRMYLPLAAVVVAVVLGGYAVSQTLTRGSRFLRAVLSLTGAGLVMAAAVGLGIATFHRNALYRDPVAFWEQNSARVPNNARVHNNLGLALSDAGQPAEAIDHLRTALKLKPDYADAETNLGNVLGSQGLWDVAIAHYNQALKIKPASAKIHNNLGTALLRSGDSKAAMAEFRTAVKLDPALADAHYNLGNVLADRGRGDEGAAEYRAVLEIDPRHPEAHFNLGAILAESGQLDEAATHFRQTLAVRPDLAAAHASLAAVLFQQRKIRAAVDHWRGYLRLPPSATPQPQRLAILNRVAWILATHYDPAIRNGTQAVDWANEAVQLSGRRKPDLLDTLAAAYAENGQFQDAIQVCRRAVELARLDGDQALAAQIQSHLQLFQKNLPYRDTLSTLPAKGQ